MEILAERRRARDALRARLARRANCRALVRRIAQAGHGIACHGYLAPSWSTGRLRPEELREDQARAKALPSRTLIGRGAAVTGRRASRSRDASLWALDVLIDLGFRYDSSIFPIHHDLYGMPGATPEPTASAHPRGRTLAEFPMSAAISSACRCRSPAAAASASCPTG